MRRIRCRGDCGRWWYYDGSRKSGKLRGGGRPREWCPDCLAWHTRDRKRPDAPNLMAPSSVMPERSLASPTMNDNDAARAT